MQTMNLRTTLAIAAVLLSVYIAAIGTGQVHGNIMIRPNQFNIVTAQQWHKLKANPEVVLIGSSKIAYLRPSYFDTEVINLGLIGNGSATGMQLLRNSVLTPQLVLIEMGTHSFQPQVDERFVNAGKGDVRADEGLLPYDQRPMAVLLKLLCPFERDEVPSPAKVAKASLYEIEHERKSLTPREIATISANLKILRDGARELIARGTQIAFISIPCDSIIQHAHAEEETEKLLDQIFAGIPIKKLSIHDGGNFETTDMVHLSVKSAKQFAKMLDEDLQHLCLASGDRVL